ncbi:hypothetical protein NN561_016951 [Cricetulus griseus]
MVLATVITARMKEMEKCPGSAEEAKVNEGDRRADVYFIETSWKTRFQLLGVSANAGRQIKTNLKTKRQEPSGDSSAGIGLVMGLPAAASGPEALCGALAILTPPGRPAQPKRPESGRTSRPCRRRRHSAQEQLDLIQRNKAAALLRLTRPSAMCLPAPAPALAPASLRTGSTTYASRVQEAVVRLSANAGRQIKTNLKTKRQEPSGDGSAGIGLAMGLPAEASGPDALRGALAIPTPPGRPAQPRRPQSGRTSRPCRRRCHTDAVVSWLNQNLHGLVFLLRALMLRRKAASPCPANSPSLPVVGVQGLLWM